MHRLVVPLLVAALLAGTPPAAADPDRLVLGEGQARAVGEEALALIDYPWRRLGWPVHFLEPVDGLLGLTKVHEERIEIYVRPGQPAASVAAVLAHEIGHVVDLTYYGEYSRARWLRMRGLDEATPWWPCDGCTDFDTGSGDFAEVFAHAIVPGHWRGLAAPPPSDLRPLLPLLHPRAAADVR